MRHFTLEEALAALPDVARYARRMVDARAALLKVDGAHARLAGESRSNGSAAGRGEPQGGTEEAERLRSELVDAVDALEELGVLVKDVDRGLVDFPALHPTTGETVYLCWMVGEETIGFWHEVDTGFAGRKPLPFG